MSEFKTLSETLRDLSKEYGKESVSIIGDDDSRGDIEAESTNCYSIDQVLGCGGLPKGRLVELFGSPSGGKSTIALYFISQIQKKGLVAAYIDAEFSFSSEYAKKIGVDTSKLILAQPTSGEEALDIVEKLVKSNEVGIIVVDSTAALSPEKELDGGISDPQVAVQARLLSKALRKITPSLAKSKTILIFISQLRDKIGYFVGDAKDSTGGNAIKFFASIRLEVNKVKSFEDKDGAIYGNRLQLRAKKNKCGLPFRVCQVDLLFEKGIDIVSDAFDVAVANGIVSKEGNTYSYAGNKIAVGRDNAVEQLKSDEKTYALVKDQVMLIGKDKDEKEIKQIKNKK